MTMLVEVKAKTEAETIFAAKPLLVDQAMSAIQGVIDTKRRGRFKLQSGRLPQETLSVQTELSLTDASCITPKDTIWFITDGMRGRSYLLTTDADFCHITAVRRFSPDTPQNQLAELTKLGRRRTMGGVEHIFNPSTGSSFVYQYGKRDTFLQEVVRSIRE